MYKVKTQIIRRTIIFVLIALVFVSCVSENEQSGLDKITTHYGAKVSYTKGVSKNIDAKAKSVFNIIVEKSSMLDTLNVGVSTTNIATLFYGSLTSEEQKDCDEITVELINSVTKESSKYIFDGHIANACWDQSQIYHSFSQALLTKDYNDIANAMLKKYYKPTMADDLSSYMKSLTEVHGELVDYKGTGIGIIKSEENTRHYQYSGFLTFRDGYKWPYIINTSIKKDNDEITGFNLQKGIKL